MAKETKKTTKVAKAKKTEVKPTKSAHTPRKVKLAEVKKLLTKSKYGVEEAMGMLSKLSLSKFTGSADLLVRLNLTAKQANESVRGSIVFPNQFAESKKILVFADGAKVKEAEAAGADFVGAEDLVAKVEGGWMDFDVVIAQPSMMVKIAKLGKVLGPRQLMPNPKTGTVTDDLKTAIGMYKAGKVDFKMDPGKSIKLRFGKLNQEPAKLVENFNAAMDAIQAETRKLGLGAISKINVSPTMGPSLEVSL